MIDTTGGFDPRKLLQMQPSPPQTPIDMYRSDTPDVSMGMSPPQIPVSFQQSPPQVPIDMYRSDNPPPVSMQASPPQTPVSMNRSDTPTYTNPNIIPNVPPHQPIGGGVVPGISGDNTTLPKYIAGRETNWGSGTLDELKTYTGQSDWTDARTEMIRKASGNPDWGKNMNAPDYQKDYQNSISLAAYSGVPTGPIPSYTASAAMPQPQQAEQPQDRWLGTQRKKPSYF